MKSATEVEVGSSIGAIAEQLARYRERELRVFSTSSFQTNSVVLLHILATHSPDVPVYFLDTGYHFPETLQFKQELEARFGLEVRNLRSDVSRLQQRDASQRLLFASDPEYCCHLNKVAPLEPVLARHDVWISGLRASQSATRASLQPEELSRWNTLKYHPLLAWTAKMVTDYRQLHSLPAHPLDAQGYVSVGCEPCTRRVGPSATMDDRTGRWIGLSKTECGLHL